MSASPAGSAPFSLAELPRNGAERDPDRVCFYFEDRELTWRQLYDRSCQLGQALVDAGVQPQDRVLFLGKNCPEFFEVLFGVSTVAGVTAGVNWRLAPPELVGIINHAQAKVLLVGREFLPQFERISAELETVDTVIVIGPDDDGIDEYEQWLAKYPAVDARVPMAETDVAIQTYTSGTTGLPKGVMSSNAGVQATFRFADTINLGADSVAMISTPVFHATGVATASKTLNLGGSCVIARESSPDVLLALIQKHRVTVTTLVPAILKLIMDSPRLDETDLSSIDTIAYAASPISPELLERSLARFGCRFVQFYGLTETNSATVLMPDEHADHLLSAGRPLPGVTVRVVDPETGADQPDGVTGEVWISSPTNMVGYWRDPVETAATVTPDGFIRTGDAACLRDGFLYLQDWVKDMIVSGAENIYPVEVENALSYHPQISEVAVIGIPSERWGESVLALVVRRPGADDLTAADVIAFARERLAHYKCPSAVEFVTELPRNPTGKLLKRVLREPYWKGEQRRIR